jgi:serine O-acetyltransferase
MQKKLILDNFHAFIKVVCNDFPYSDGMGASSGDNFSLSVDSLGENKKFKEIFFSVFADIVDQHGKIRSPYFSKDGEGFLNQAFLDHYLILCYRVANRLFQEDILLPIADAIYYSCRIRTSTDLFYRAKIDEFFIPVHPLGAVIDSKSTYGLGLRIYNGVHIGPYDIYGKEPSEWEHPELGDGVIVLGHAKVYGNSVIGDNVVISVNSIVINEKIPNNCIVMGASPDIKLIPNMNDNLSILHN